MSENPVCWTVFFCLITFIKDFKNLNSQEAIKEIEDFFNIKISTTNYNIPDDSNKKNKLFSVNNLIAELYDETGNDDLNLVNEDGKNYKKNNKTRSKFLNALEPELKKKNNSNRKLDKDID